jgi:hypothetical protein
MGTAQALRAEKRSTSPRKGLKPRILAPRQPPGNDALAASADELYQAPAQDLAAGKRRDLGACRPNPGASHCRPERTASNLSADILALQPAGLAVGRPFAVIGFLQFAMRFGHVL